MQLIFESTSDADFDGDRIADVIDRENGEPVAQTETQLSAPEQVAWTRY